MKAAKARKKAFKAIVKKLYKESIVEINKQANDGKYKAQVKILDTLKFEDRDAVNINKKLFKKLENKGYELGMTICADVVTKNVFWNLERE